MSIRVLMVEDSEQDAELLREEFALNGMECIFHRVEAEEAFRQALNESWDLILCDYRMPGFTAVEALRRWRETGQDLPFIIVSGAVGEREAVEVMRMGARDFVHKDNLSRLIPVVQRELEEAFIRKERQQAKLEIEGLRERSDLILNSTMDGVIGLDGRGYVTFVNPAAEQLLGYAAAEIVGEAFHAKAHHSYVDGSPYPAELCPIQRTWLHGQTHRSDRDVLWRKDGTMFPAEYSSNPMREGRGAVVVFRDVTEKKKAEEQREQAIQVRDEVMAMVSHDLKTPLSGIDLNASMILRKSTGELPREFIIRRATIIKESASRMNRLISDLLDVTRIEAGKFIIYPTIQDAQSILDRAIHEIAPLIEGRQIALKECRAPGMDKVVCDIDRIGQVFANLLGNAVKFMPEQGGEIRIECDHKGEELLFSVSDNGPGIAAGDLPHVFDRFWHARKSTKAGTGLGLAIAEGIVRAHLGRIWAESEPGRGATFRFSVPFAESYSGKLLLECESFGARRSARAS